MHDHPYAKNRFKQAHDHLEKLKPILESGDLDKFIALIESEALTLHAMMMTSMPYFILMKPNTLEIINKIWSFREDTDFIDNRKSTRLNSSHVRISYAVFCLKKK